MKIIYSDLLIVLLFIIFSPAELSAQKKMTGIGMDRIHNDSSFYFLYNRDTTNDGSYITHYTILKTASFMDIKIVHLVSEQRIDITFNNEAAPKKIIKYQSNGGYIIMDGADTIQYDVNNFNYRFVLFFKNSNKDGFVFINQITALTDETPKLHLTLDVIPATLQKENRERIIYYLKKGNTYRKGLYDHINDSLKYEKQIKWQADSISFGNKMEHAYKQKSFQEKRDTTTLVASYQITNEYIELTRHALQSIVDTLLRPYSTAYFKAYSKFLVDTSGVLQNIDLGIPYTNLSNSDEVTKDLNNQFSKKKLTTMKMYDDSDVAYSMSTKIQFPLIFEKETMKTTCIVYKKAEPIISNYTLSNNHFKTTFIDSLKKLKRGKYHITLSYKNIINDTTLTITKLKSVSDKNYVKVGICLGTFLSQTGSNPIEYNSDLNFPYLSVTAVYRYGGVFFGGNFIPVFGADDAGIVSCDLPFTTTEAPVYQTYNSTMKYNEYGVYVSPAHLLYLKAGTATQKNTEIIYSFSDKRKCFDTKQDANGFLFGVAFVPKFFTLEVGYNSLLAKPFFNLGFNIPINTK